MKLISGLKSQSKQPFIANLVVEHFGFPKEITEVIPITWSQRFKT